MGRVAKVLRCPLWVVGEMAIGDYLDEVDAHAFFYDLDNPPAKETAR